MCSSPSQGNNEARPVNETTQGSRQKLLASHPQWLFRAMLLVHFGGFLIWQPVWRGERKLDSRQAFLIIVVGLLLAGWTSWWLMAVWLAVIFALIGGNVLGRDR